MRFFIIFLLIFLVYILMMAVITADNKITTLQNEATERGFARYNPTNGVWQWTTNSAK